SRDWSSDVCSSDLEPGRKIRKRNRTIFTSIDRIKPYALYRIRCAQHVDARLFVERGLRSRQRCLRCRNVLHVHGKQPTAVGRFERQPLRAETDQTTPQRLLFLLEKKMKWRKTDERLRQ